MSQPAGAIAQMTLAEYSEALASSAPSPGGGSVAAVAAGLAAGLGSMVVRVSLRRPAYEAHAALHEEALEVTEAARLRFLALADEDRDAFSDYVTARRMARDPGAGGPERSSVVREAARRATAVPLSIVQECHRLAELVERLAGRTNAHAGPDLDVAALLLDAAARGAAANAIANLEAVADAGFSQAVLGEIDQRLRQTQKAAARTREQVRKASQRAPEAA